MTNVNDQSARRLEDELKRMGELQAPPPAGLDDTVIGAIAHAEHVRTIRKVSTLVLSGVLLLAAWRVRGGSRGERNPV